VLRYWRIVSAATCIVLGSTHAFSIDQRRRVMDPIGPRVEPRSKLSRRNRYRPLIKDTGPRAHVHVDAQRRTRAVESSLAREAKKPRTVYRVGSP